MKYLEVFSFHIDSAALFCRVDDDDELMSNIKCHYSEAQMSKTVFSLGDCVYVKVSFLFNFFF